MSGRPYLSIDQWIARHSVREDRGYESPCWIWTGSFDRKGYPKDPLPGQPTAARKKVRVHRASYEHHVGPIPEGLQIDHLCRVNACINPGHLEPVTGAENLRRADLHRVRAPTCGRGHPFTPENTIYPHGSRSCRQCKNDRQRLAARERRAAAAA